MRYSTNRGYKRMIDEEETKPNITPRIVGRLVMLRKSIRAWTGGESIPLKSLSTVAKSLQQYARTDYEFGRRGIELSADEERGGLCAIAQSRSKEIAELVVSIVGQPAEGMSAAADIQQMLASWAIEDRRAGRSCSSSASFVAVPPKGE